MPFKGDMRLGGPHDNEARLNGTSDGPSVPTAGTIIGTLSNTAYVLGPVVGYYHYASGGNEYISAEAYTQRCTVNIIADGIGGQSYDYTTATNIEYYPSGTILHSDNYTEASYLYFINGQSYENGTVSVSIGHDGQGSIGNFYGTPSYSGISEFYSESLGYDGYFPDTDSNYPVGNFLRHYYHDNAGGYSSWDEPVVYFGDGYEVGEQSGNTTVSVNGTDYPNGSYYNKIVADGGGGLRWGEGNTYYTGANYLIYVDSNTNDHYYHSGDGSYFVNYGGPLPTGNTGSGDNYININGNDYQNGTYSYTEYHDGTGGFYSDYSYSYAPYGTEFFNESSYDSEGNWTGTTYYKSDEAGGYYTE